MKLARSFVTKVTRCLWLCAAMSLSVLAQDTQQQQPPAPTFKPEELDQIVAPIALFPDSLLAQIFMASTYPLEIVEAARWSKENPKVTGDALSAAMEKQSWDPAVKSLTAFPDVITMMSDKLDWTQKLGDAFLAQQKDVMDAVQRLRAKAQKEGNLKSSKEQTVKTEPAPAGSTAASTTIITIEPSDPQVVYVPQYNPTVVYGAWPYPAYPPYPVYPPGAAFFSFSVGVAVGSALWGGCNWGHSDVDINVNNYNNFNRTDINNRNTNINNRNTNVRNNSQTWQHNPDHRKGVQYRDNATQQKFNRGSNQQAVQSRDEFRGRAEQGREQINREGAGNMRDTQGNQLGGQTRDAGNRDLGGQSRDAGGQSRDLGGQSRDRSGGGSSFNDRSRSSDAFRGMNSGSGTRAASSRGMSSRSAGGMSRGGGGRRR
jgi:uncharacterized membrane protein YgcG